MEGETKMQKENNLTLCDFINKDRFELSSYLTYLIQVQSSENKTTSEQLKKPYYLN